MACWQQALLYLENIVTFFTCVEDVVQHVPVCTNRRASHGKILSSAGQLQIFIRPACGKAGTTRSGKVAATGTYQPHCSQVGSLQSLQLCGPQVLPAPTPVVQRRRMNVGHVCPTRQTQAASPGLKHMVVLFRAMV